MPFKLTCPNDPTHVNFTVTAHVAELWKVDQGGNFLESIHCDDVIHQPDRQDLYVCHVCNAQATVADVAECLCHPNGMAWAGCPIHGGVKA